MTRAPISDEKERQAAPAAFEGADRRRGERQAGEWQAELQTSEGTRIPCTMVDISSGGAKLRGERLLPEGEIVTLVAESFAPRRSRIAWMRRTQAGLTFLGGSPDRKFLPF